MAAQVAGARKFVAMIPAGLAAPRVWTDGETEVVFEWIANEKHAIVSFERDGNFGYAMLHGDQFEPGSSANSIDAASIEDLVTYLSDL